MMIRILNRDAASTLITRKQARLAEAEAIVAPILAAIRARGDSAVLEYARKFDNFSGDLRVPQSECAAALDRLTTAFRSAVEVAAKNIRDFARVQLPRETQVEYPDGRKLGQIVRPLDSMGAYIPAGRYPLPSTLLMTVIPAQVAGVPRIAVACPRPSDEILGICTLLNVREVYRVGGAQAIAAFAYGTESISPVERIVGPGNIYVAAAKKLVAGETGIDFIAGPTEIVIIAAEGDPKHLAADMLAQAEHDTDASSILITASRSLAESVAGEIDRQLATLPTAPVACEAIAKNSAIVLVDNLDQAAEISNAIAPEHLNIPDASLIAKIHNAGSIFIGPYSPEAAGDYATGPNHVLPTSGAARLRGGLSAADFVKIISTQEISREALRNLTPSIVTLARAEGLEAHARSVEVRDA
jgi:histidinol dehydrogenase